MPASKIAPKKTRFKFYNRFGLGLLFLSVIALVTTACKKAYEVAPLASPAVSAPSPSPTPSPTKTPVICHPYLAQWGGPGSGDGQFNNPAGIAVDPSGFVYVADMNNHRVQKFTDMGAYVSQWTDNGGYVSPVGIALDGSGNVWVADLGGNVWETTNMGTPITQWGTAGNGPIGITLDPSNDVYVAFRLSNQVIKYAGDGTTLGSWGASSPAAGSADGSFNNPHGLVVNPSGDVAVADLGNDRLQVFDPSGAFLLKWGAPGYGTGQMEQPNFIAVDPAGNFYVTDNTNDNVSVFTGTGTFTCSFGSYGTGPGQLTNPWGIALDTSGNIFVSDYANNRIEKFGP